jgi:hypothetical protein
VKIHSERVELSKSLKVNVNKGYMVAVALALIFVFSLLIGYFFLLRIPSERYTTIYVLDYQQKKAIDYPELLVIGKNNTFDVWVGVKNQMGERQSCEVLQKVINGSISLVPVEADVENSYAKTMENGETWETLATISINEPGSYFLIFELWIYDEEAGAFEFSNNYSVLSIEVVDQI